MAYYVHECGLTNVVPVVVGGGQAQNGNDEIKSLPVVRFSQPTTRRPEMAAPRSPTQSGQSTRAYPLKWMEDTFNSKERTESLLRPEVENGNVTYHDMELTQASEILLLSQFTMR